MRASRSITLILVVFCCAIMGGTWRLAQGQSTDPTSPPTETLFPTRTASPLPPTVTATPRFIVVSPTAPPTVVGAPFIKTARAIILFPAAVVFEVELDLNPERIESATLRVWQDQRDWFVQAADLKKQVRGEANRAVVISPWEFTPEQTPPLFSTVNYTWTIRLKENVSSEITATFAFQDVRLFKEPDKTITGWLRYGIDDQAIDQTVDQFGNQTIGLISHNPNLSLPTLANRLARVIAKISADTGRSTRYRFAIYEPTFGFCDVVPGFAGLFVSNGGAFYKCDPANGIAIYARNGYTVIERTDQRLETLQNRITEHVTRESFTNLWQAAQPPAWFREGIIQLYRLQSRFGALPLVREASRNRAISSLADLEQLPTDLDQAQLWMDQSYLLTLYIASRYGAEAPVTVARSMADLYTFRSALGALYQTDPQQLYADWRIWLFTTAADDAVGWTPYLATTPTQQASPTPSATPTETVIYPTPTRTLTPTFPPPPTISPVPPTPSNTPLPPGSLRSPTPIPPPPQPGALAQLNSLPIMVLASAVILGIAAIIAVGSILFRRRTR